MMAERAKSGRGGRRAGAGRKPSVHGWSKLDGNFFYVMHEGDSDRICKIGIAAKPFVRLANHQVSNWRRLKMAVVYSCPSAYVASALESYIRVTLKGRHVLGEWFEANPSEIEREVAGFSFAHGVHLHRIDVNDYRRDPYERNVTQKIGAGG
jgi:hypothetical protein